VSRQTLSPGYEKYRESQAAISRARSATGREIGTFPRVKSRTRWAACRNDLRLFCETYLRARFHLAWSPDHLRCLAKLQAAALEGGQFAFAMPRGTGKTSLVVAAALWSVLYGHRSFVVLVGATDGAAGELLDSLKVEIETNPLLGADFPKVCHPVRRLEGIVQRGGGQTFRGERTRLGWTDDEVVLPTVKGSDSSGAVVKALGITGRVRGLSHTTAAGRTIRPDLVILDDPQTDESAASPTQNAKREALISKAVLGLAGPTTRIAAVMPCTVIAPGDMADRALDRELHPEWNGERTKLIYDLPTNVELWEQYAEIRRQSLMHGRGLAEATEFYRQHRAEMDAGARVAWPERYNPDEISATQHAMNLRLADYRAFMAEYQNDPERGTFGEGAKEYNAQTLAGRLSGTERYQVPREATRLTTGIDCGARLLWYVTVAWTESGGGVVVDYGCHPAQNRPVFEARDARPSLIDAYPGHTESQLVFAGLRDLTADVLGRTYYRDGGGEVRAERALVDSGWQAQAVYQFVRASNYQGVLLPSKGVGRTTTARGVGEWRPRPGERTGFHWRLSLPERGSGRTLLFDPDPYKSLLFERLTTPPGGGTALTLFGRSAGAHALFAEHLAAEYSTPATLRGVTFDKWEVRPDRPDNHLLDCLVLAAVAASLAGLQWSAAGQPVAPQAPRRRTVSLAELQRARKAAAR
jgi:hypothetical protein